MWEFVNFLVGGLEKKKTILFAIQTPYIEFCCPNMAITSALKINKSYCGEQNKTNSV